MTGDRSADEWSRAIAAVVFGAVVFVISALNGRGIELIWLPAVLLAAAWPTRGRPPARRCMRRFRARRS
jgi:hypothetical protein